MKQHVQQPKSIQLIRTTSPTDSDKAMSKTWQVCYLTQNKEMPYNLHFSIIKRWKANFENNQMKTNYISKASALIKPPCVAYSICSLLPYQHLSFTQCFMISIPDKDNDSFCGSGELRWSFANTTQLMRVWVFYLGRDLNTSSSRSHALCLIKNHTSSTLSIVHGFSKIDVILHPKQDKHSTI